jgi:plastocyanin
MNKGLITILIIIVLALGGGAAYYIYKQANKKADTATQTSSSQQQMAENADMHHEDDTSSTSTSTNQSNSVTIQNFAFSPANITVKKGTTVTWTNKDSAVHDVVSSQSGGPKSDHLEKGESFSFKFDTTGTFNYICSIHPSMKGVVTVTD